MTEWRFTAYPGSPDARFQPTVASGVVPVPVTVTPLRRDRTLITGVKWPFRFVSGRVGLSSGTSHLMDNVRRIIAVGKGESVMLPDFGSDLHRRVFDPINVSSIGASDIRDAIRTWEPRVQLNAVTADLTDAPSGVVNISVSVTPLGQNDPQSIEMSAGR